MSETDKTPEPNTKAIHESENTHQNLTIMTSGVNTDSLTYSCLFSSFEIPTDKYRLFKKTTGEIVLQREHHISMSHGANNCVWRDIPLVIEEESSST